MRKICGALLVVALLAVVGCGGSSSKSSGGGGGGGGSSSTSGSGGSSKTSGGGGGPSGAQLFSSNGCGGCHTLSKAGSNGTTGPDLDKQLPQDAKRAGKSLVAFTRESIVNPGAYVAKGYQNGIMPKDFGQKLSKAQIDALVKYVSGK